MNGSGPVEIYTSVTIVALVELNEMDSSVTLQIYWNIIWQDPRLNIPSLWDALSLTKPSLLSAGIQISKLIYDQNVPLNVWLPDLFFEYTRDFHLIDEDITLYPGGEIYWSRNAIITVGQAYLG